MSPVAASSTDVFVIGGGPAGLAAAIAARQRGFRVMVADGMQPPIDKACGEGLLPDSLAALERLGIRLFTDSHPFRGVRFVTSRVSADARFPANGVGSAIRRTTLHRLMMERASQLNIELLWQKPVTSISPQGVFLGERFVRTRWIVGADGSNSRVRRWAGLDRGSRPRLRFAFRRHFRVPPWSDHMEVFWGDGCQGYAMAVNREQVCVALASLDPQLRLEEGLRTLPELGQRLRGAVPVSSERGALTGNRSLKRVWRKNVALIGDASGTVDAITGEGLGLAFSQAVALAESFSSGNLTHYQTEHRKLAMRPHFMARLMLMLDGRPGLQRRTITAFQQRPEIFRHLLGFHVGEGSPLHVALNGLRLGWRLLTA